MTRDEVLELLQVANGYDNRKIDNIMAACWSESARRARWTFHEAVDAVHEHFASGKPREYLMPGHVTEHVRASRRYPAPMSEIRALDPPPPASEEKRAEVMRMVAEFANKKAVPPLYEQEKPGA
ncbi:hypothetical protein [Nocardia aurea]|uniref:hypothetical protein n=1 Tax=Nocardia aurea TaxID=2144174 RepID=UPI0033B61299